MSVQTSKTMIHPTAIVHPEADIAPSVSIGPYSIIESNVSIGEGTRIGAHVKIEGNTTIGRDNEVFTGAVLGSVTQDKKYDGGISYLKIGDRNKIREYVTMNPGTAAGTETVIGNDNLIMAYAHIAHDCILGNHVIIANAGTLAGHVIIEDRAIVGGLCGVHQFVRIGYLAIVGGNSKVVQDIPPFVMTDGHPAKAFGLNSIGLERAQVPQDERSAIKRAYKILFRGGTSTKGALKLLLPEAEKSEYVARMTKFIAGSERGICK